MAFERSLRAIKEARGLYRRAYSRRLEDGGQETLCLDWLRFEREEGRCVCGAVPVDWWCLWPWLHYHRTHAGLPPYDACPTDVRCVARASGRLVHLCVEGIAQVQHVGVDVHPRPPLWNVRLCLGVMGLAHRALATLS